MEDNVKTGLVSDHQQPEVSDQPVVDNSQSVAADAPKGRKPRRTTALKVSRQKRYEAAQNAVLAANHLKAGEAPPASQLALADPEVLAAEIRQALNLPPAISSYHEATRDKNQPPTLGRPTEYTEQEAAIICQWVSNGNSLRKYSQLTGRQLGVIYRWMGQRPSFREMYANSFADRADTLADEMVDIADSCTPTIEAVAKAKLQIETRRWCAERMRPQKWGNVQSVGPTQPITFNIGIAREPERVTVDSPTAGNPVPPLYIESDR